MQAHIYLPTADEADKTGDSESKMLEAVTYLEACLLQNFNRFLRSLATSVRMDLMTQKPVKQGCNVWMVMSEDDDNSILETIAMEAAKIADIDEVEWQDFQGEFHSVKRSSYHYAR